MGGGNRGDVGNSPMGNGFQQRPNNNLQDPAANNTKITPDKDTASIAFDMQTSNIATITENLVIYSGLFAIVLLLTLIVAKKKRNY